AAMAAADRALAEDAGAFKAHGIKGRLLKDAGRLEEAEESLKKALQANPRYVEALNNLGVVCRMLDRPGEAIGHYKQALALKRDVAEVYYNLANAFLDQGAFEEAVGCYNAAINLKPDYVEAHETLSKVLWEQGRQDDYLASIPPAMQRAPRSVDLPVLFAKSLLRTGETAGATEIIEDAIGRMGADPRLEDILAKVKADQGDMAAAVDLFRSAIEKAPGTTAYRQDFARLLVKLGDYDEALTQLAVCEEARPLDQEIIAYKGLCWRFLGDPREVWLNDYERFVRPITVPVPDGYSDHAEFNAALDAALTPLHQTKVHPADQTLRGGTQTMGALFRHDIREVQEVRSAIEAAIRQYIDDMPDDPDHPLLGRKTGAFMFSGSWSVRLKSQGFHVNHLHSMGWLSSAYYVALPESQGQEGWIKFGETNMGLGEREEIKRLIAPAVGTLVLFPSYMFHGTVPFAGTEHRTTIAFDVIPAE
ncbi:MAG: tetratricopeptide repeat protein, partial [Sphingomonadales bacterium]|nr:tetratricopeptide repeat protein [Sphingomonadales bacterium]